MIKKWVMTLILFFMTFITSGYTRPDVYTIDAGKNATLHNNIGLNYVSDRDYYDAIQEFTLAIALNPKSQATAIYYNNLGETYMKLCYFKEAQRCFENAIALYNLNFLFYQNLVKSFKAQKLTSAKIKFYAVKSEKDSLNMIVLGLLYVANGDIHSGIIKLDEFCMKEPDLLITGAVRDYLKEITPKD